jgi:hypothetical protein
VVIGSELGNFDRGKPGERGPEDSVYRAAKYNLITMLYAPYAQYYRTWALLDCGSRFFPPGKLLPYPFQQKASDLVKIQDLFQ